MTNKTLVSELEYLLDINLIDTPEVYYLVLRSIKQIRSDEKELLKLRKKITDTAWKDSLSMGTY